MNMDEVIKWLNENQGLVAAIGIGVMLFVALESGLLKMLLKLIGGKPKTPDASKIQTGDIKAGGNVIVSEHVVNMPTTQDSDLRKKLAEMHSEVRALREELKPPVASFKSNAKSESHDFTRVKNLIAGEPTEEKKKQLRALFYSSTDKTTQLQIVLTLVNWFVLPEDSIDDLINLCDEGIRLADSLGATSEKAVLLAYKGRFLSFLFVEEDEKTTFNIQASSRLGFPLFTEQERNKKIDNLHSLDKLSAESFAQAKDLAIGSKSYKALALVHSLIGEAAGERSIHFKYFGINRAEEEKKLCKRALLSAKQLYAKIGDEVGVAYALHNLANKLRLFGETEEAKQLTEKVIKIATKHTEQRLVRKAKALQARLISGKILNDTGGKDSES